VIVSWLVDCTTKQSNMDMEENSTINDNDDNDDDNDDEDDDQ